MQQSLRTSEIVFWANENQELKPAKFDHVENEIRNFAQEHKWFSEKHYDFHKKIRGEFSPTNQIVDIYLPLTQKALFDWIEERKEYIYGYYAPQEGEKLYYLHLGYIIVKDMSRISFSPRYSEHYPNTLKQLYQNLVEIAYKLSFNHTEIIKIK